MRDGCFLLAAARDGNSRSSSILGNSSIKGKINSKSLLISSRSGLSLASGVVPFFPIRREAGLCEASIEFVDKLEVEDERTANKGVVVAVGEVLCDTVEGDDEVDCAENKPCVSKRRRMFHVV